LICLKNYIVQESLNLLTLCPQNQLNAVAAMFLTTEAVIADKPEKDKPCMPDMGGMGGMGSMM
jgi:hypothetical protein